MECSKLEDDSKIEQRTHDINFLLSLYFKNISIRFYLLNNETCLVINLLSVYCSKFCHLYINYALLFMCSYFTLFYFKYVVQFRSYKYFISKCTLQITMGIQYAFNVSISDKSSFTKSALNFIKRRCILRQIVFFVEFIVQVGDQFSLIYQKRSYIFSFSSFCNLKKLTESGKI